MTEEEQTKWEEVARRVWGDINQARVAAESKEHPTLGWVLIDFEDKLSHVLTVLHGKLYDAEKELGRPL